MNATERSGVLRIKQTTGYEVEISRAIDSYKKKTLTKSVKVLVLVKRIELPTY